MQNGVTGASWGTTVQNKKVCCNTGVVHQFIEEMAEIALLFLHQSKCLWQECHTIHYSHISSFQSQNCSSLGNLSSSPQSSDKCSPAGTEHQIPEHCAQLPSTPYYSLQKTAIRRIYPSSYLQ